jgi:hypothetical protein
MKTLFTVLSLLSFLLLPHAQAQVSTITLAGGETYTTTPTDPYEILYVVTRYPKGSCDLTCTIVNYSFCENQVAGCLEGWTEVPNSTFRGAVGTSWTNNAILTLNAQLISDGGGYGKAWYCNAWDSSGNCSNETPVYPVNGSPNQAIGLINVVWQKSTAWADLASTIDYVPGSTTVSSLDKYAEDSTGVVMGYPVSASGTCCLALLITDSKTNTVPSPVLASETMAGKQGLSEPALKRLREIERKQKAAIAARAK